ncbi:MAG: ABC transporter substrate-binding protein [Phycisphaerales bacterium]
MFKSALPIVAAGLAASAMLIAGFAREPAPVEAAAQPAKKLRIGVSVPAADHGWTAGVTWWAKRAMELYPDVDWVFTSALTPEKQIADVQDMMVKKIDALIILCTESKPLTPVARRVKERGIFIVNVDRGFEQAPNEAPIADIFLEGDNKAFGRKSAEFIAQKMGGKGNLVVLTGIPCTVDTDRVNAALEVLARFPEIKILARQPAMWNREKGFEVMKTYLTQFPKIDAVWAQDDDIALGAVQAIKQAGRQSEMWVFPGAGMKEVVKMVMDKDPMVPADITYPPSMIAAGIHTCVSILRDGNRDKVMQFMPQHIMLDVELITPENAKRYYFPESVY